MRNKQALCVRSDLVDNSVVFSEDKVKFTVVHFELIFLQENDLSTLRNVNTDSGQAFCLTDQSQNLTVEVDIEFIVVRMPDNESGLKSSLCLLNLMSPLLAPEVLEREESVAGLVVHLHKLFGLLLLNERRRELLHRSRDPMEEMS